VRRRFAPTTGAVKRGLVASPEEWCWSSFRFYYLDEPGLLTVTKIETQ
jgi:hypothetical protein